MSDVHLGKSINLRVSSQTQGTQSNRSRSKSLSEFSRAVPSQGGKTSNKTLIPDTGNKNLASTSFRGQTQSEPVIHRQEEQHVAQHQPEVMETRRTRSNVIGNDQLERHLGSAEPHQFEELHSEVKELGERIAAANTKLYGPSKEKTGSKDHQKLGQDMAGILKDQIEISRKVEIKLKDVELRLAQSPNDKGLQKERHELLSLALQSRFPFIEFGPGKPGEKRIDMAAQKLADMRDRLPQGSSERATVTSTLLNELARVPGFSQDIGKKLGTTQSKLGEAVDNLLGAITNGSSAVAWRQAGIGREGDVRSLLSGLRKADYQDKSAQVFLADILNEKTEWKKDAAHLLKGNPDASSIRSFIQTKLDEKGVARFDDRMKLAGEAAGRRDQIEEQTARLQRALGGGQKGSLAVSSTLFAMSNVLHGENTKGNALVGTASLKLLREIGTNNKAASFQVARLAVLLEQSEADHEALGIPNHEANFGKNTKINAASILAVADLDVKDMKALGYKDSDAEQIKLAAGKLGKTGFKNPADALRGVTNVTAIGNKVFGDISNQAGLKKLVMKDNSLAIRQFENDLMAEAVKAVAPLPGSDKLSEVEARNLLCNKLNVNLLGADGEWLWRSAALEKANELSSEVHGKRLELAKDQKITEEKIASAQKVLIEYRGKKGGDGGLDKPAGYRSAKLVVKALDLQKLIDQTAVDDPQRKDLEEKRDNVLQDLRGLDTKVLQRRAGDRISAFFHDAKPPTIDEISGLRELADAIIFLRKGVPEAEKGFNKRAWEYDNLEGLSDLSATGALINNSGTALYKRDSLAHDTLEGARQIIRLAIAKHMPEDSESFEPLGQRTEIETMLKTWGLDTSLFQPELDQELLETVDNALLQRWHAAREDEPVLDKAIGTDPEVLTILYNGLKDLPGLVKTGLVEHFTNRRELELQQKQLVFDLITKMKPGDMLEVKHGGAIDIKYKHRFDPSGLTSATARIGGSWLDGLVIEKTETGFSISGLKGGQGRLGIDLAAGIKAGHHLSNGKIEELRLGGNTFTGKAGLEIKVSGEVHGSSGAQLHFNGDNADESLQALFEDAIKNAPLSSRLMESIDEVRTERRIGGSGGIEGSLGVQIGMREDEFYNNGGGAGVSLEGSAGVGGERRVIENLDMRSVETSFAKSVSFGLSTFWFADVSGTSTALREGLGNTGLAHQIEKDINGIKPGAPLKVDDLLKTGLRSLTGLLTDEIKGFEFVDVEMEAKTKRSFEKQGADGQEHLVGVERQFSINSDSPSLGGSIMSMLNTSALNKLAENSTLLTEMEEMIKATKTGKDPRVVVMSYKLAPDVRMEASRLFDDANIKRDEAGKLRESAEEKRKLAKSDPENAKALKKAAQNEEDLANVYIAIATNLESQGNEIMEDEQNYVPDSLRLVRVNDTSGQKTVIPGIIAYAHEHGVSEETTLKAIRFQ